MTDIDGILTRIHEASLQPDRWPEVAHDISRVLGERPIMFGVQWLPSGMSFIKSAHLPVEIVDRIITQYSSVSSNPMTAAAMPAMALHTPIRLDDVLPIEEFSRTEYYKETIAQMDGIVGEVGVACAMSATRATVIVLARRKDQPSATDEQIGILTKISPHLGHAMEVMVRLGRLRAAYDGLDQVLCRVAQPVALLDSQGALIFTNAALEELLVQTDQLVLRGGRLRATDPTDDRNFQELLESLTEPSSSASSKRSIRIGQGAVKGYTHVFGQPIHTEYAANLELGQARAILFVSNPDSLRTDLLDTIARQFNLSRRQSEIVQHIIDGSSGPDVAKRLSISNNTLKTHMERIYEKTETRSREDLFKRLISVAAQTPRFDL